VVLPDLHGGVTVTTIEEAEALAGATTQHPDALALLGQGADWLAADSAPWARLASRWAPSWLAT
jgi:hypothetical protein